MADIDTDPFGEHELRPEEPTDKHILLIRGRGGVQMWDPRPGQSAEHEQETSFTDNERKKELVRMLVHVPNFGRVAGSEDFAIATLPTTALMFKAKSKIFVTLPS